jgi:hypothetical protein
MGGFSGCVGDCLNQDKEDKRIKRIASTHPANPIIP